MCEDYMKNMVLNIIFSSVSATVTVGENYLLRKNVQVSVQNHMVGQSQCLRADFNRYSAYDPE